MNHSLGNDVFSEMMDLGFIRQQKQFKKGMFMNDDGKRLFIKQVFPSKSSSNVDIYVQYAHVVTPYGHPSLDPGVVLGFDLRNREVHPVLYRNDLLDHTIHIYEKGSLNEDNADWLLKFCSDWFNELHADDYDRMDPEQLKAS